jgi:tripartite tricarboxylate transporter family receptor
MTIMLRWGAVVIATVGCCPKVHAAEVPDFKGKKIELGVGSAVGSGPDLATRLVGRHLGRFIPGNPTVFVVNRVGAGNLVHTNYMAQLAPKDGSTIAWISREAAFQQLAGRPEARFDLNTFQWIGSLSQEGMIAFIRRDKNINSIQELQNAAAPIVFAVRAIGSTDFLAAKGLEALGVRLKIISSYRGGAQINLAFEQGEYDASALTESALKLRHEWAKPGGLAVRLVEFGSVRVNQLAFGPDLKPLPSHAVVYPLINSAIGLPSGTFTGPPGMSKELTELFSKAFVAMSQDPQFLDEASRIGVEVRDVADSRLRVSAAIRDFLAAPADAKKEFATLIH